MNAASYAKDANEFGTAVAPGSLVQIYGDFLGATADAATYGFDLELGNLTVTFNGITAMLGAVTPTGAVPYVNAQVPFELLSSGTGTTTATVVATINGLSTPPQSVPIVAVAPGIFTIPPTGQGNAILVFANPAPYQIAAPAEASYTIGYPTAPIPRGTAGFFYATGLGQMTPPIPDGTAFGTVTSYANSTPTVLVGGVTAEVLFAGQAPNYVGVNQIIIVIPENAPTGDSVPIQIISADGTMSSNIATIAVR